MGKTGVENVYTSYLVPTKNFMATSCNRVIVINNFNIQDSRLKRRDLVTWNTNKDD
jgi:hypothetical protein